MRHLAPVAFLSLPLALAACSPEPAEEGDVVATQETEAPEPEEEATLDLQADGLIVPAQGGFEQLSAPFGSMRAPTEATLANVLGEPTGREEGEGDCELQSTQYEGMTLNFRDDEFVGYIARAPYVPELTRGEMLEDSMVELVEDSTLGEEFVIGNPDGAAISGLFDGDERRASVDALWAGENCIVR